MSSLNDTIASDSLDPCAEAELLGKAVAHDINEQSDVCILAMTIISHVTKILDSEIKAFQSYLNDSILNQIVGMDFPPSLVAAFLQPIQLDVAEANISISLSTLLDYILHLLRNNASSKLHPAVLASLQTRLRSLQHQGRRIAVILEAGRFGFCSTSSDNDEIKASGSQLLCFDASFELVPWMEEHVWSVLPLLRSRLKGVRGATAKSREWLGVARFVSYFISRLPSANLIAPSGISSVLLTGILGSPSLAPFLRDALDAAATLPDTESCSLSLQLEDVLQTLLDILQKALRELSSQDPYVVIQCIESWVVAFWNSNTEACTRVVKHITTVLQTALQTTVAVESFASVVPCVLLGLRLSLLVVDEPRPDSTNVLSTFHERCTELLRAPSCFDNVPTLCKECATLFYWIQYGLGRFDTTLPVKINKRIRLDTPLEARFTQQETHQSHLKSLIASVFGTSSHPSLLCPIRLLVDCLFLHEDDDAVEDVLDGIMTALLSSHETRGEGIPLASSLLLITHPDIFLRESEFLPRLQAYAVEINRPKLVDMTLTVLKQIGLRLQAAHRFGCVIPSEVWLCLAYPHGGLGYSGSVIKTLAEQLLSLFSDLKHQSG